MEAGRSKTVEISEILLQLQEQIMLYKPIKDYVAQYPHLNLAIGIGRTVSRLS